jgi:hypothetical protein
MLLSVVLTTLVQELSLQIEKTYKKLFEVIKLFGIAKKNDSIYSIKKTVYFRYLLNNVVFF